MVKRHFSGWRAHLGTYKPTLITYFKFLRELSILRHCTPTLLLAVCRIAFRVAHDALASCCWGFRRGKLSPSLIQRYVVPASCGAMVGVGGGCRRPV